MLTFQCMGKRKARKCASCQFSPSKATFCVHRFRKIVNQRDTIFGCVHGSISLTTKLFLPLEREEEGKAQGKKQEL